MGASRTKIKGFIPRPHYLGSYFYAWVDMESVPTIVSGTATGWNEDGDPIISTPLGLRIVPVLSALLYQGEDPEDVRQQVRRRFLAETDAVIAAASK